MPNKTPLELDEETLDFVFAQLENYIVLIEQDLGYFPYIEVMASLFMFASVIAKANTVNEKDFITLSKKIYKEANITPEVLN